MTAWYQDQELVREIQTQLDWFNIAHHGILGPRLTVDGVAGTRTKDAVKRAKYELGYPDAQITWATGVDQALINRLHHPTLVRNPLWITRGLRRRRAWETGRRGPTRTSVLGVNMIAAFEGYAAPPQPDPVGYCTGGYGHLIRYAHCTPADHTKWDRLGRDQWKEVLADDLHHAEGDVARLVKVPLTQGQFDALVSFVFNVGAGALAGSTLLRLLNTRNYTAAAHQFSAWTHAGGHVLPGLVHRRNTEANLFRGPT